MDVTVVDFGKHADRGEFEVQKLESVKDWAKFLKTDNRPAVRWDHSVRWIDIEGPARSALNLLAAELNLPAAVLDDVEFDQTAKVNYFKHNRVMQIVTHACMVKNCPVEKDSKGRHRLISKHQYMAKRPSLAVTQIHLIIVDNHTVITCRKDTVEGGVHDIWSELIDEIEASVSGSFTSPFLFTAQSLATEVLDDITETNWLVRDQFRLWKNVLEESIRSSAQSIQLQHALDIGQMSLLMQKTIKPSVVMLGKLTENKGGNSTRSHMNKFIDEDLEDFQDVFDSYNKLHDQISLLMETVKQLQTFYKTTQDDRMNRTLFLLTTVTTMLAPLHLVTSIYGMNFEYMPELHYEHAYPIFWAFALGWLLVVYRYLNASLTGNV
jgi:Mg2+ and Co2+ transporter CorA